MISHTQAQLDALEAGPVVTYCIKFSIGATEYRLTASDVIEVYLAQNYSPWDIELDDIEITSEPKTNDIKIQLGDPQNTFVTAILSDAWMNKECTIVKMFKNQQGQPFLSKIAFEGFLTAFSIDEGNSSVQLTITSVWADFEKQSGIKTNLKSQQRYYPLDTAGRHASDAIKKIYWGKESPQNPNNNTSSGGGSYTPPVGRVREN